MKVQVSEAEREVLDYMVAMAEWIGLEFVKEDRFLEIFLHQNHTGQGYCYSRSWLQGGPIIEREEISLEFMPGAGDAGLDVWVATRIEGVYLSEEQGPTPLVAAMRCFVASRLGDEVNVPDELV